MRLHSVEMRRNSVVTAGGENKLLRQATVTLPLSSAFGFFLKKEVIIQQKLN